MLNFKIKSPAILLKFATFWGVLKIVIILVLEVLSLQILEHLLS
jgi:hypothetical protein